MASYTQQEELDQLKAWWKNYGVSLIVGVVLGLALLFGYRYWHQQRETQREAASALYQQMLGELRANPGAARGTGEKIMDEFSSTPYAGMAALLLARQAHDSGDVTLARERLQWALKHTDGAAQHAARLRLARLLLGAGDVQAAVPLAAEKDISGFEAEYYELRGDLALAQQQPEAARAAYAEALKHIGERSPYRQVVAMKLDNLGIEK